MSKLNESRKTNWKDSDVLTLVKTADGRMIIETKDRYYDYKQMSEALYEYAGKNIKLATERPTHNIEIKPDEKDTWKMMLIATKK